MPGAHPRVRQSHLMRHDAMGNKNGIRLHKCVEKKPTKEMELQEMGNMEHEVRKESGAAQAVGIGRESRST